MLYMTLYITRIHEGIIYPLEHLTLVCEDCQLIVFSKLIILFSSPFLSARLPVYPWMCFPPFILSVSQLSQHQILVLVPVLCTRVPMCLHTLLIW
jgi:hypothetical protein